MALFVHHGPRLATLATGLVERLAAPAGDPFDRLGRRRADRRRTRLADPPPRQPTSASPPTSRCPIPGVLRHGRRIRGRRRPVERRAAHLGGARRARRGRSSTCPAGRPSTPVATAGPDRRSASPSPGGSPTCSTATSHDAAGDPPSVAAWRAWRRHGAGHAGRWTRANRRRAHRRMGCRRRCAGSSTCGGASASGSAARARPTILPSASNRCVATTLDPALPRDRRAVRCQHAVAQPSSTCSPPSPAGATCTCRCSIPRSSPGCARHRSIAPTQPSATGAAMPRSAPPDRHPLLSSWGRQRAETAALVRGLPRTGESSNAVDAEPAAGRRGHAARSSSAPTSVPTVRRPRSYCRVATRAFRCTPATARSASSRCSATRSVTCSSATRRCAPTTSWSSVPTWPASSRSPRPCSAAARCPFR